MIKLLARLMGSEQSEELNTDVVLLQEIEDTEASKVSGGFMFGWFW